MSIKLSNLEPLYPSILALLIIPAMYLYIEYNRKPINNESLINKAIIKNDELTKTQKMLNRQKKREELKEQLTKQVL